MKIDKNSSNKCKLRTKKALKYAERMYILTSQCNPKPLL